MYPAAASLGRAAGLPKPRFDTAFSRCAHSFDELARAAISSQWFRSDIG
jgi:hypothetical protein